jgi:hypothetical protein
MGKVTTVISFVNLVLSLAFSTSVFNDAPNKGLAIVTIFIPAVAFSYFCAKLFHKKKGLSGDILIVESSPSPSLSPSVSPSVSAVVTAAPTTKRGSAVITATAANTKNEQQQYYGDGDHETSSHPHPKRFTITVNGSYGGGGSGNGGGGRRCVAAPASIDITEHVETDENTMNIEGCGVSSTCAVVCPSPEPEEPTTDNSFSAIGTTHEDEDNTGSEISV